MSQNNKKDRKLQMHYSTIKADVESLISLLEGEIEDYDRNEGYDTEYHDGARSEKHWTIKRLKYIINVPRASKQ